MVTRPRILVPALICFSAVLHLGGTELQEGLEEGIAMITSRKGHVVLTTPEGKRRSAELHAIENLTGIDLETGKEDYIFFALSNKTGFGIYENSQVRFVSYQQKPYLPFRESLDHEPSHSKLVVQLTGGSISFSADRLSPLSEIVIQLPKGEIHLHKGSGRVVYDETGVTINVLSGIVSYTYPNAGIEEFINAPYRMHISDRIAELGQSAKLIKIEPGTENDLTEWLVNATHRARNRVIYRLPSDEPAIPQPILVARPEALLKPSPRPYSYLD